MRSVNSADCQFAVLPELMFLTSVIMKSFWVDAFFVSFALSEFSITYEMPVPGIETVCLVFPDAVCVILYPGKPQL